MRTARTFLTDLRHSIRFSWLVFRRDLKAALTKCQRCKVLGAYPCSIAACIPMCEHCSREESIRLDKSLQRLKHYREIVSRENINVNGVNTTGGTPSAPFGSWAKRR